MSIAEESVSGTAAERDRVVSFLATAVGTAGDYEVRYRAIQGIAALGDDAAVRALSVTLRGLPADRATTAALRQVAALGVARNPSPEGTELLSTLARDADPGVRLRAMNALAQREPTARGTAIAPGAGGVDAGRAAALCGK